LIQSPVSTSVRAFRLDLRYRKPKYPIAVKVGRMTTGKPMHRRSCTSMCTPIAGAVFVPADMFMFADREVECGCGVWETVPDCLREGCFFQGSVGLVNAAVGMYVFSREALSRQYEGQQRPLLVCQTSTRAGKRLCPREQLAWNTTLGETLLPPAVAAMVVDD
jgi:hypothetical protein